MKINWPKRNGTTVGRDPVPVPQEVKEFAADTGVRERRFNTIMDELIDQHRRDGGFEDLKGKGKPLQLDGDGSYEGTLNRIMKDANVLPKWLELQKDVCAQLQGLHKLLAEQPDASIDFTIVNNQIRAYNRACPSPLLQKPLVTRENLASQLERWQ